MNRTVTPTDSVFPSDAALLDAFIPGYSMVSGLLRTYLQVDLSAYLPFLALSAVVVFSANYLVMRFWYLIEEYCVSTAEIRMDDEISKHVLFWVAQQPLTKKMHHFIAATRISPGMYFYDDMDGERDGEDAWNEQDEMDENGNVLDDFDEYWARTKTRDRFKRLRFTPAAGRHYFWFRGHLLWFNRVREDNNPNAGFFMLNPERLYISCFGRNPAVLKELLAEAQHAYVGRDSKNTVIYRAQRDRSLTVDWVRCMARAPRPLSTVVLDAAQKQAFVNDIKEYLHPRTRRWYSNRGIPYRRGYLLHGPPGTGKTSLSFAAAGLLGLEMYLLNLSSKTLTEDDLMGLFHGLPRRCIVLLEDVDCAGITHQRDPDSSSPAKDAPDAASSDPATVTDTPAAAKDASDTKDQKGVSLSGLLNVIDGVAASEGRILIMTTNHIDKLDSALLRPGRVDMSIEFGYSAAADIRDLFESMYTAREEDFHSAALKSKHSVEKTISTTSSSTTTDKNNTTNDNNNKKKKTDPLSRFSPTEIRSLAAKFADAVPAGEISAAEIQGHLLNYKTAPDVAVAEAAKWVRGVKAGRRAQTTSSSGGVSA
ncbi:BCS1 and AAA domain-containing protein [Aspergillus candidus]|uniref:BCS1 N terminal-domain-containing protein n=1 Tax=Aspergillus candidus TaxID=41067 RepID=A0A2I2FE48_ASPCN|nr:BCS1 N terminal-domain-containing protein [Aspergillus candidus]PLB38906.1 BCS1 N terminal-domain-containing protein [Aspergillus candidus]